MKHEYLEMMGLGRVRWVKVNFWRYIQIRLFFSAIPTRRIR
jgi:hypothetical protein